MPAGITVDPDLHLHPRHASRAWHGTIEAEQLLHGGRNEGALGDQPFPLGAMAQEGEQPVPDETDRGVVASDVQQDARREQLSLGQPIPRFLGGQEPGQELRPRIPPTNPHEIPEVRVECLAGGATAGDDLGVAGRGNGIE